MRYPHILSSLALAVSVVALVGCNDQPKTIESAQPEVATTPSVTESTTTQRPVGDTPETSLDWNGDYEGILPCADCEGIKTELELNLDKTFELKETYLGKGDQSFETKGTFKFSTENLSVVILSPQGNNEPRQFFIGEGFAEARAMDGSEITGDLKPHYRLNKQVDHD